MDDADTAILEELPGGGVGEVPLTPIVSWMIERTRQFDRHTQTALLTLPPGIEQTVLERTVQSVLDHHDMLRARLQHDQDEWMMDVRPAGAVAAAEIIRRVGVDSASGHEFSTLASAELDRAAGRLDPGAGSMLQLVWFDAGSQPSRLLIVAHHLVVDGVSWRILVPDLASAWSQVVAGQEPVLAPVGTSMRRWAHGLRDEAVDRRSELDLWKQVLEGPDKLIGSRPLDPAVDVYDTVERIDVELSVAVTEDLLTTIPDVFHGSVNDGLMAGLALAIAAWRRTRGGDDDVFVSLEGHGREDHVVPGADLGRTLGWFTTIFPVRIDLSGTDIDSALDGGVSAGSLIKSVKERLLAVPDHGIGYGMLRYLDEQSREALAAYPVRRSASTISAATAQASRATSVTWVGYLSTTRISATSRTRIFR
ncbi:condensation domain-containing protein [Rhodococcus sp. PAMC28707]|uniref:condensation domain-containing protein n=1 Tax=Rhodococcus sp. PAMC28707 TaxID=2565560 RepID=UPI001FF71377|nr:condensation domain-containing protein [Rhodococcus sp. PAMC28707]